MQSHDILMSIPGGALIRSKDVISAKSYRSAYTGRREMGLGANDLLSMSQPPLPVARTVEAYVPPILAHDLRVVLDR